MIGRPCGAPASDFANLREALYGSRPHPLDFIKRTLDQQVGACCNDYRDRDFGSRKRDRLSYGWVVWQHPFERQKDRLMNDVNRIGKNAEPLRCHDKAAVQLRSLQPDYDG